ncbi:MAG: hypothetical protein MZW92_46530 [Comamonadaceae bacterium]|nr:hypothetical protein [Comamonadaceae bacterium]
MFHWHGETFGIPAGAAHIEESPLPQSGFRTRQEPGTAVPHRDDPGHGAHLVALTANAKSPRPGRPATVQRRAQMLTSLARRTDALHRVADTFYSRWIQGLRH